MTTGHARFCTLAAEGHAGYISMLCGDDAPPATSFPPLIVQAGNLAGAVGRFVASGMEMSTGSERTRRMEICGGCAFFAEGRCSKCGCSLAAKVAMASEHCPLDPPKW